MSDILVVYFSLTGYTQRVAQRIAHLAGADCEAIREPRRRRGLLGFLRSSHEAMRGKATAIEPAALPPRDYPLVVIGGPVWASRVCSPVRAYLARHRGDLQRVALFCTQGSSSEPGVLRDMAALCGRVPVATASFPDFEIDSGQYMARADDFASQLRIIGRQPT